jgi:hypothetical protein
MTDTSPEIERIVHERLMAMSGEQRFLIGICMFETAREIVLSSFPKGLSQAETRRRLCERFYGDEVDPRALSVLSKT